MDEQQERYHNLLELIGQQRRDFQQFENSVLQSQSQHWKSVTTAIRTLSDWWAKHADDEVRIRKERQVELDKTLAAIRANQRFWIRFAVVACILALGIVVGALVL